MKRLNQNLVPENSLREKNATHERRSQSTYHSGRRWAAALNKQIFLVWSDLRVDQYFVTIVIRDAEFGAEAYSSFVRKKVLRKTERNTSIGTILARG